MLVCIGSFSARRVGSPAGGPARRPTATNHPRPAGECEPRRDA